MQYTTLPHCLHSRYQLFYQDFKDTFVCNTQRLSPPAIISCCCFIRISKILLYAIHNHLKDKTSAFSVVLSRFQRYFCMQYTTSLSRSANGLMLFYQDFKDTFVCNTQLLVVVEVAHYSCFIRISMNNLSAKLQKTYEICKFI